jgi:hypothetical protein
VGAALRPYCNGRLANALVFEHDDKRDQPICGSSPYRRFRNATKRAGLPVPPFHEHADLLVMPTWGRKSSQIGLMAA